LRVVEKDRTRIVDIKWKIEDEIRNNFHKANIKIKLDIEECDDLGECLASEVGDRIAKHLESKLGSRVTLTDYSGVDEISPLGTKYYDIRLELETRVEGEDYIIKIDGYLLKSVETPDVYSFYIDDIEVLTLDEDLEKVDGVLKQLDPFYV